MVFFVRLQGWRSSKSTFAPSFLYMYSISPAMINKSSYIIYIIISTIELLLASTSWFWTLSSPPDQFLMKIHLSNMNVALFWIRNTFWTPVYYYIISLQIVNDLDDIHTSEFLLYLRFELLTWIKCTNWEDLPILRSLCIST